jgi:hypothetical protein
MRRLRRSLGAISNLLCGRKVELEHGTYYPSRSAPLCETIVGHSLTPIDNRKMA